MCMQVAPEFLNMCTCMYIETNKIWVELSPDFKIQMKISCLSGPENHVRS
jgi:hypothetical protein